MTGWTLTLPRVRGVAATLARWKWAWAGLGLLLLALLVWKWSAWHARASLSAAYGARMTCSCRYVEGRSMESCKGDREPGMMGRIASIADDPSHRAVTGSVMLTASRTARYRPGFGCLVDPE